MLFNADSNIDFSDIQQVKDKLTYIEGEGTEEEQVKHTLISDFCTEDGVLLQSLALNTEDNGLVVVTDEVLQFLDKASYDDLTGIFNTTLESKEFDNTAYQHYPQLLNTVPTMNTMLWFMNEFMNSKLEQYVMGTVDDGTEPTE